MKEGSDFPFYGFPKLWINKNEDVKPGWEIFFKEKLTFKEKPIVVFKKVQKEVDWIDYVDVEALGTMLKEEGDMFVITTEEPSDPSTLIMPTNGQLNNWT